MFKYHQPLMVGGVIEKMAEVKFVNLTPHAIVIFLPNGNKLEIPPSGQVARVATYRNQVGTLSTPEGEIPLVRVEYGEVEGLPERPEEGTVYIVSLVVAQAVKASPSLAALWTGRLLVPDTSPQGAVRDSEGRIIGVKALQVY